MQDYADIIFLIGQPRVAANSWRGNIWHVAILYKGLIWETLSNGLYRVLPYNNWPLKNEPFVKINNVPIDTRLLKTELTTGTDCATYVARAIGIDKETIGTPYKNPNIYPADIYVNLIHWKSSIGQIKEEE